MGTSLGPTDPDTVGRASISVCRRFKNLPSVFTAAIPGLVSQLHFTLNRLVFPAVEPSSSMLASGAMTDWFPLAAQGSTME